LQAVFKSTYTGNIVFNQYHSKKKLTKDLRPDLMLCIIQHFYLNGVRMGNEEFEEMVTKIAKFFCENKNLYYVPPPPQKNSPSRGKLSDKYRNYLKKIRSIRPINDTLEDGIIVKNAGKFEVNLKDKQYFS
jgi:hypothetical protein